MTKVKVNHNGSCMGYNYTRNEVVSLPDEVLQALGKDSYTVVNDDEKQQREEAKKNVVKKESK